MKCLFMLALIVAAVVAYPAAEAEPDVKSELQPEAKTDEKKNTLLEADANPQGDNAESEAERAKRFIFLKFFSPIAYAVPIEYTYPAVSRYSSTTIIV